MVNHIYPSEFQLNKANVSDTVASFLDLHSSISGGFVKTKIFANVNFQFLDGDIPHSFDILWCLYFSTYSFCSSVQSCRCLNTRNKVLTAKLQTRIYIS